MSESSDPEKKIVVDSDWKEQVRREKEKTGGAAADQPEDSSDQPTPSPAETPEIPPGNEQSDPPLPAPQLSSIISMLAGEAIMALEGIPNEQGQHVRRPNLARHLIDMIAVLDEKTKGNRTTLESQIFEATLHQLRLAYVEQTET